MSEPTEFDAFVLAAIAAGIAASVGRFGPGEDLVAAVAHRTEEEARLLASSVAAHLSAHWAGSVAATKENISLLAGARLAPGIASAVANFVTTDNNYVH